MKTLEEEWVQFTERIGNPEFRLPTTTRPRNYKVSLTPYFDIDETQSTTVNAAPFTFDGEVDIFISATEANVSEIVLHCNDMNITSLTVTYTGTNNSDPINIAVPDQDFFCDPTLQFLRINTTENLALGQEYVISSTFVGNVQTDMRGFYRSWYNDSSGLR